MEPDQQQGRFLECPYDLSSLPVSQRSLRSGMEGPSPAHPTRQARWSSLSKWSMHKILNAVFYVVRTGCQWRLLPHDFPPWSTVHHYFRLWRLDGTWEKINAVLREKIRVRAGRNPQPSAGILDTQSVKTTNVAGARAPDTRHIVSLFLRRPERLTEEQALYLKRLRASDEAIGAAYELS
jgi:transposase